MLVEILSLEGSVGSAERDGLVLDLLDAAAGTDRLIVQADAGLFLIGVRPLGVDRVGKRRARAGDVGGAGGGRKGSRHKAGRCEGVDEFQGFSPCLNERKAGRAPRTPSFVLLFSCY